jgi:CheY-like chemotaxis protein
LNKPQPFDKEHAMNALHKRVLVVDDDPVVGRSFDRVLSDKGYEVSTAANGQEALARLSREEYDVVFTDIKMPGMDGLEVASRIKQRRPWIPVVIITGYGTPANEARAAAAGVAGFMRKPLSPDMIEDGARRALQVIEGGRGRAEEVPAAPGTGDTSGEVTAVAAAVAQPEAAPARDVRYVKNLAMLFAAPLIGLAFVIAAPFMGLGVLAWSGIDALARRWSRTASFVKNAALFFAAPFIGLAYAVAFPFVGLALLVRHGLRAMAKRGGPR